MRLFVSPSTNGIKNQIIIILHRTHHCWPKLLSAHVCAVKVFSWKFIFHFESHRRLSFGAPIRDYTMFLPFIHIQTAIDRSEIRRHGMPRFYYDIKNLSSNIMVRVHSFILFLLLTNVSCHACNTWHVNCR